MFRPSCVRTLPLRILVGLVAASLLVAASVSLGDARVAGASPLTPIGKLRHVPQELIVRHVDGASERDLARARQSAGAVSLARLDAQTHGGPRLELVKVPQGVSLEAAMARLAKDATVLYVEPNFVQYPQGMPNDPLFPQQWGLHNTGQLGGSIDADIDAPEAADRETGSASVYVGVVDTGIDFKHPDLRDVLINPGEDADGNGVINSADMNGIDDDGNGLVDDVRGWDFSGNDNTIYDPTFSGDTFTDAHGTHVAGIIGARGDNGIGVTGVNRTVRLIAAKFLGASGTTANAVKAIDYFTDLKKRGVNVVATNNSWGSPEYSLALKEAIERAQAAGILFVAAAGNGGDDFQGDSNDAAPFYPASYPMTNVISVTAIDPTGALAYFANSGAVSVDIAAPGYQIYSTGPKKTYRWMSGTSMATPHVTGICALLKADKPELTYTKIRNRVLLRGVKAAELTGKVATGSRANAYRSLYNTTTVDP